MSDLFEEKIFIRGSNKISENAYLVFRYQNNYRVYRYENIKWLDDSKSSFKLAGFPAEGAVINPIFLELKIGNILVNNVLWFIAKEKNESLLEIKPLKANYPIRTKDYILSILTIGIWGCLLLKDKNAILQRVAENLLAAQRDLCELPVKEVIKTVQQESRVDQQLEEELYSYRQLGSLEEVQKIFEGIEKCKAVAEDFKVLGERDLQAALRLKKEYDNLAKIENAVKEYYELRDEFGSPESIRRSINTPQVSSSTQTIIQEEPEELVELKKIYGSIEKIKEEIGEYKQLKDKHGSLENITQGLQKLSEELPELKNKVSKLELQDSWQKKELDKWNKESENIERAKNNFGSWENLFKAIESYKELDIKFKNLGDEDYEKAVELKKECGSLSKIEESIKEFQSLKDEFGAPEKIRNLINNPQVLTSTQTTIQEESQEIKDLIKNYGSIEQIRKQLEDYQQLKDKYKELGDSDYEEAVKLKNEYGNLAKLGDEFKGYQQLKSKHGSLETIQQNLEKLEELPKLQSEVDRQTQELDEWNKESLHIQKAKNTFGSWEALFLAIESYKALGDEDLESALDLKRKHGNLTKVRSEVEEHLQLRNKYGSIETIHEELKKVEEITKLQTIIEQHDCELKRWRALALNISLETLEKLRSKKIDNLEEGKNLEYRVEDMLNELSEDGASNEIEWAPQYHIDEGDIDFFVRFKNKHNQHLKVVIECKWHSGEIKELENFEVREEEDDSALNLIKAGIKQLCKYYKGTTSNIGLLITNTKLWGLDKKGVQHISLKHIPKEYQKDYMNLLLVHEDYAKSLIRIIKCVNNIIEPESEAAILSREERQQMLSDPSLTKFITEFGDSYPEIKDRILKIKNKLDSIANEARIAINHFSKYEKVTAILDKVILDFKEEYSFYTNKPLSLERGSVEIIEEDEEINAKEDTNT